MFATHTSVRIKGTEKMFEPQLCTDSTCSRSSSANHMHCPFCFRSESFADQQILRAHYQVKHVDKSIEFAGLKMLRCCDRCDIIGSIKGNKDIKRPHWHCFSCKNGFNRRDEALKHYRTHFKTPQTTFQLQIAQEVYQAPYNDTAKVPAVIGDEFLAMIPSHSVSRALEQWNSGMLSKPLSSGNEHIVQVSVAANETVDGSNAQPIMIVHHQLDDLIRSGDNISNKPSSCDLDMDIIDEAGNSVYQVDWGTEGTRSAVDEVDMMTVPLAEHRQQLMEAETRNSTLETELRTQIRALQQQVEQQSREIGRLRGRELQLIGQLTQRKKYTSTESLVSVISNMKKEYGEMLKRHQVELDELNIDDSDGLSSAVKPENVPTSSRSETLTVRPPLRTSLPATSLSQMVILASGPNGRQVRIVPYKSASSTSQSPLASSSADINLSSVSSPSIYNSKPVLAEPNHLDSSVSQTKFVRNCLTENESAKLRQASESLILSSVRNSPQNSNNQQQISQYLKVTDESNMATVEPAYFLSVSRGSDGGIVSDGSVTECDLLISSSSSSLVYQPSQRVSVTVDSGAASELTLVDGDCVVSTDVWSSGQELNLSETCYSDDQNSSEADVVQHTDNNPSLTSDIVDINMDSSELAELSMQPLIGIDDMKRDSKSVTNDEPDQNDTSAKRQKLDLI